MSNLNNLNNLTFNELEVELLRLRKEQFGLRMKKANGVLDKTHHVRVVRKAIARVKTMMTKKVSEHHDSK